MKNSQNGIWIGGKDLNHDPEFIQEAQKEMHDPSLLNTLGDESIATEVESSRRDFLKYLGFGLGAATVAAGCEIPVKRAIPYVVKPDEIVPGVATYYASTYVKGGEYCPVLVKTREGRPIKIEGNALSPITSGGTSARAQASVLDLYDVNRIQSPQIANEDGFDTASWDDINKAVSSSMNSNARVRIVSNTILSPSFKKLIGEFTAKYPNTKLVQYDPVSASALLDANQKTFGQRVVPDYRFDKADYIVSFNADFLGTWISPIEYNRDYISKRKITSAKGASMSRHVQVESHMSMTGSNADNRILVKPSEQSSAVAFLYNEVTGGNVGTAGLTDKAKKALRRVATQLHANRGHSIILCGNNNLGEQLLVNAINNHLGNYGNTINFGHASMQRQGSDADMASLVAEMNAGRVDVLIVNDANPVYDYFNGAAFAAGMAKVKNKVGLCYRHSETSALCNLIAPIHHGLESWGDAEAKRGQISIIQPTIHPLFDTKQAEEVILGWSGSSLMSAEQPYFEYLKSSWSASSTGFASADSYVDGILHDGVLNLASSESAVSFGGFNPTEAASSLIKPNLGEGVEISFQEPVSIGNGVHANNPWLQEMPDPVTRTTWGNYLAVPVEFDGVKKFIGYMGLKDGSLVQLTIGDKTVTVPVVQQFGQMPGTVSLSLGYGVQNGGFASKGIGENVNDCLTVVNDSPQYFAVVNNIKNIGKKEKEFSCVQYHNTMGVTAENKAGETINADEETLAPGYGNIFSGFQGALVERSIIRRSNLDHLEESVDHLVHEREHFEHLNQQTLYPFDKYTEEKYAEGHHWGMHVDLTSCTGCSACTVACMAENNVPVVGKKKVSIHQEMSWLRIDRYYFGDVENPNTVYQPLMCQHCDNAPCENVCPVNATNHSSEGLNQMTYNRCIGTRYCANNCPYKVRRFNWSDYTTADIFPANQVKVNGEKIPYGADNLTRMVLNPDVTVRSRGVIEKCSFCVQRIQEGKLSAKTEGRRLVDSDVRTACQTACPTGAITFGDINNKKAEVSKKFSSPLSYEVLEEVNVRSSVRYSMKVTNKDENFDA